MTLGHLDLIQRAASIFDDVTVAVMVNRAKTGCIPYEERAEMIVSACRGMENVHVDMWQGLLADYMRMHPGSVVLRGIRSASDYEYEAGSAAINRRLCPGLETVFLPASDGLDCVSSSVVREIAAFGGEYGAFVPACNRKKLKKWLKPFSQDK